LRDLPVANLRDPLEIALALGPLGFHAQLVDPARGLLDLLQDRLLTRPARRERVAPLTRVGELRLEPLAIDRIGGELDLQLHDAAVRLVELVWAGIDLDAE